MALPTITNVARPKALGYAFRLNELYLRGSVAPDRPLDVTTADLEAQKINTATSSEDLRNESGAIFSRSSFVGGEGLDHAHQRDLPADAAARFWDSQHIDISNPTPGEPASITLLKSMDVIDPVGVPNPCLAYDGTAVYQGADTTIRRSVDPSAETPTFADDPTGSSESVLDLTNLGSDVYAALGTDGIYKRSGSWASLASSTATWKVWGVKLLLLGATGSGGTVLSEINVSNGTPTTRVSLPNGQQWLDVADCGAAILACASDGNVYALASVSGTLALQAQTPMPAGEIPYCIGFDGSFVFIGTREDAAAGGGIGRMYRMELAANYVLGAAQLLRQWGTAAATSDQAPRRIIANRKGVVWGIDSAGGQSVSLWRYDSASGGVSRHLSLGAIGGGVVADIVSIGGHLFATNSSAGICRENATLFEPTGYLIGPLGDLFNASQKSWAGALIDHNTIPSDCRVELYYTTEPAAISDPTHPSWQRVKNVLTGQDTTETPLRSVDARFLAGMVKLYAGTDLLDAPAVRGFAFRAYPGPGDIRVTMAINTSDLVTIPGRRTLRSRGLGQLVYDALKNLEGRYAELEVLSTGDIARGVVEKVSTRIPDEPERGSASVVTMVTFLGRRVPTSGVSGSDGMVGLEWIGVSFIGGRES